MSPTGRPMRPTGLKRRDALGAKLPPFLPRRVTTWISERTDPASRPGRCSQHHLLWTHLKCLRPTWRMSRAPSQSGTVGSPLPLPYMFRGPQTPPVQANAPPTPASMTSPRQRKNHAGTRLPERERDPRLLFRGCVRHPPRFFSRDGGYRRV